MATSENCRSLCGVVHLTEAQTRLLRERIEQGYHVHLYVEIYRRHVLLLDVIVDF